MPSGRRPPTPAFPAPTARAVRAAIAAASAFVAVRGASAQGGRAQVGSTQDGGAQPPRSVSSTAGGHPSRAHTPVTPVRGTSRTAASPGAHPGARPAAKSALAKKSAAKVASARKGARPPRVTSTVLLDPAADVPGAVPGATAAGVAALAAPGPDASALPAAPVARSAGTTTAAATTTAALGTTKPTARGTTDSASGEVAPATAASVAATTPPAASPLTESSPAGTVAATPGVTVDAPNVAGAPNFAGRLSTTLAREDVVAPLTDAVYGGSGPEVMHVQVLLDAARFSPGAVSGVWNENTVFAIRAFRVASHMSRGDSADAAVVARLERLVGAREPLTEYTITPADVAGPYRRVPGSMYEKAKVDCLCYQSMLEMLGERFHATTDAIRRLNPAVDVNHAPAGTRLVVPNIQRGAAPAVARLVVDKREGSIRGVDAGGGTRFWLPVTVGSPTLPSPIGRLHVVSTTPNPRYRYDPVVLGEARGGRPNALLAPGPNSPVGVLWAQLSRPHVGLHGTPDPEDVGYTMSHGCVRMANWDARWLTPMLRPGLPVDFQ